MTEPSGPASGGGGAADPAQGLGGDGARGAVQGERGPAGALHGGADALGDEFVVGAAQDDGGDVVGGVRSAAAATAPAIAVSSACSTASASPWQGTSVTRTPEAKSRMRLRW
ncbi:hypothetical protein GCM10020256_69660 [Streptomyces thermocoprophilus]